MPEDVPVDATALFVCNVEHRFLVASQLQQTAIEHPRILLEPDGRNTAPAFTLAALLAIEKGDDPIMLMMPSDQVVGDVKAFRSAIQQAFPAAVNGDIVTFGVEPDSPMTGYGYIQTSKDDRAVVRSVKSFVEKPSLELAEKYLASGNYLWNSGMFMVRASVWLKALQMCRPEMLKACEESMIGAQVDLDFVRPNAERYSQCPADSIDYAVMECLPTRPDLGIRVDVVPLLAGWSDLGTWDAIWNSHSHDEQGNAQVGNTVQQSCRNSLLFSSGRLIAGVGLDHIAVIETSDAVLVANMRNAQDVKKIVAHLCVHGHSLVHAHRKVHRPWGWYDKLDYGDRFQVKRIVVNPGASLSLQMHHHRAEHWVVVSGTAEVTNGDTVSLLGENESTFIPLGHIHRLRNPGKLPLEVVEVQSGSYLGEDDIIRFSSDY